MSPLSASPPPLAIHLPPLMPPITAEGPNKARLTRPQADILTRLALIAKNKIVARIVEAAHKRVEAKATEEEKAAMKKVVDTIRRERTGLRYCKACGIFNYAT